MAIFNELDIESFFPEKSRAYVDAVIERAMRRELASGRRASSDRGPWRSPGELRRHLKVQLASALTRRGTTLSSEASVRRLSANGGRSFHFDHSSVSCSRSSASSAKAKPARKAASRSSESAGRGSAAAHMRYIERHGAVETGTPAPAITDERGRASDGGTGRTSAAAAGQGYVENPSKVRHPSFSFGTIGSTPDERMAFWDLLERHERNGNCRVQERLIVELPHEASAEARLEMVRAFCGTFERLGLPYWAALHAPGPGNDRRNYHAHVVYSTRPARRMVDPGDGALRWDFAITASYRTSSRNRKTRHPYRQKRCPEMTRKGAVRALRGHFAEVVNVVLAREDVRDAAGRPVRYDPRSHRAMGLGAPVETLKRGEAERARDERVAVPDGGHTRAGFEAIDAAAEARRDRALADVSELATACAGLATSLAARRARAGAAGQDGGHGDGDLWAAMPGAVARRLVRARSDMHADDAEEPLARGTFARLAEATSPAAVARAEPKPAPGASPAPPLDADLLQRLREEAEAEAEDFEARSRTARGRRRGANDALSVLWMGTVAGADTPPDGASLPVAAVAPERDGPPPRSDDQYAVDPALAAMPAGALERVRDRLPATLAVLERVMGAIRALPAVERSRLVMTLTDPGNLAAFAGAALDGPDASTAQRREDVGPEVAATARSRNGGEPSAAPGGSVIAGPPPGPSAEARSVLVEPVARSAQPPSAGHPAVPERAGPDPVPSARADEPKREEAPVLDRVAPSAETASMSDRETTPDVPPSKRPDGEDAARKAARRKAILAKRSKGRGGHGR